MKEIFRFDVLWKGWELDYEAWVEEDSYGNRHLIMTKHGGKYTADKEEIEARIAVYEDLIKETKKALKLLKKTK